MQTRVHTNGLTLPEFLLSILLTAILVAFLASLPIPGIPGSSGLRKGQLYQTLNNSRQLYISAFSMATD